MTVKSFASRYLSLHGLVEWALLSVLVNPLPHSPISSSLEIGSKKYCGFSDVHRTSLAICLVPVLQAWNIISNKKIE